MKSSILKCFLSATLIPTSAIIIASCSHTNDKENFKVTLNGDIDLVDCTNLFATTSTDFTTQITPKQSDYEIEDVIVKVDNEIVDPTLYEWDGTNLFIPANIITSTNLSVNVKAFVKHNPDQFDVQLQTEQSVQLSNNQAYLGHRFNANITFHPKYDVKHIQIHCNGKIWTRDVDYTLIKKSTYWRLSVSPDVVQAKDLTIVINIAIPFSITSNHLDDQGINWTNKQAWVNNAFSTHITTTDSNKIVANFNITANGERLITNEDYMFDYTNDQLTVFSKKITTESLNIDFEIKDLSNPDIEVTFFDYVNNDALWIRPKSTPQYGQPFEAIIIEKPNFVSTLESITDVQVYMNGEKVTHGFSYDEQTRVITLGSSIMSAQKIDIKVRSKLYQIPLISITDNIVFGKASTDAGRAFSTKVTYEGDPRVTIKSFKIYQWTHEELIPDEQFIWNQSENLLSITDISILKKAQKLTAEPIFSTNCLSAKAVTAFDFGYKLVLDYEGWTPQHTPNMQWTTNPKLEDWQECVLGESYHVNEGETLYLKGNNPNDWTEAKFPYTKQNFDQNALNIDYINEHSFFNIFFSQDSQIILDGECTSLLDNGFGRVSVIPGPTTFYGLFYDNPGLMTACYFDAPHVNGFCYDYMFASCPNIVGVIEPDRWKLPCRESGAYAHMFDGDTSLNYSPEIGVTVAGAFFSPCMFQNCSELTKITIFTTEAIDDEISINISFLDWLKGAAKGKQGQFYYSGPTQSGTLHIPSNWTIIPISREIFDSLPWDELISILNKDGLVGVKKRIGLAEDQSLVSFTKHIMINSLPHIVRVIYENPLSNVDNADMKLIFEFQNVICDENGNPMLFSWNEHDNNVWFDAETQKSCYIRAIINTRIFSLFPEVFHQADSLKFVNKPTCIGGGSSEVAINSEKIWLSSHDEIGGCTSDTEVGAPREGELYSGVYTRVEAPSTANDQWIKKDIGGNNRSYWLRSPTTGEYSTHNAWYLDGVLGYPVGFWDVFFLEPVAPCFAI